MAKTLKDIVENSNDIYFIKVEKPSGNGKHNHSSWKFKMVDPRWCDDSFENYKFKPVHIKRDNGFFIAYKCNETNAYFVDPRRAMYRSDAVKFVNNLIDYSVKTNDISRTKDEPSFRITQREMYNRGIENFLDLCYEYREYSAIGTGYTRNIRNLIVMDIDVDCTRTDNILEINNLLKLFAEHNSLPNFYIFNHRSKHIQLQWLIKDLPYKDIDNETVSTVISEINNLPKSCEIDYRKTDFTKISELGVEYRRYTHALCDIVKKRKFGDKNFTFWKAKNPMSALINTYDLELLMPYYSDGKIEYKTVEEMNLLFSTKESRRAYFNQAPDIVEWYERLSDVLDPLLETITEKKVMKYDDGDDVTEIKKEKKAEKIQKSLETFGESRNTFVLNCTRTTTWEIAKKYGWRKKENVTKLSHEDFNRFRNEVYDTVYKRFKEEDEKYGGIWPDTTNRSSFLISDFKLAFYSAFPYALQNLDNKSYTDEDRAKSQKSRHNVMGLKLITVDRIKRKNTKISRKELLKEVNSNLKKINVKEISLGSLKRFISESNTLTDEVRSQLQADLNNRKMLLNNKKKEMY